MAENRKATGRDGGLDRGERARRAGDERGAREAEEIGHEANVNQVRHEPMPASHDDDRSKEAVVRHQGHSHGKRG